MATDGICLMLLHTATATALHCMAVAVHMRADIGYAEVEAPKYKQCAYENGNDKAEVAQFSSESGRKLRLYNCERSECRQRAHTKNEHEQETG